MIGREQGSLRRKSTGDPYGGGNYPVVNRAVPWRFVGVPKRGYRTAGN